MRGRGSLRTILETLTSLGVTKGAKNDNAPLLQPLDGGGVMVLLSDSKKTSMFSSSLVYQVEMVLGLLQEVRRPY